jgi:glycogen(starch) synthase
VRVLVWTDWYLPSIGGVEVFSARLLPALVRKGYEITVVAGHHRAGLPDRVDCDGVDVRRFWFHRALAANDVERVTQMLAQVAELKRTLAPELIHLNTLGPSLLFHLESMRHSGVPVLLTMHSPVTDEAARTDTLCGRALRSANWVNCNSQAVRADLCRLVPMLAERSSVTYYGMETPALAPAPRPLGEPRILAFGRLVPDKGFDLALRAFASVLHHQPRAHFVLAGEGPARAELERLAGALDIAAAVEFVGCVAPGDVPALINTASLVVVPSRWAEPFGLVALEAALMQRPVIATRVGGLPEAVEHHVTGLVVESEDPAALADGILALLEDSAAAERMGHAGRVRARARFGWERCVDAYDRLYRDSVMEGGHD